MVLLLLLVGRLVAALAIAAVQVDAIRSVVIVDPGCGGLLDLLNDLRLAQEAVAFALVRVVELLRPEEVLVLGLSLVVAGQRPPVVLAVLDRAVSDAKVNVHRLVQVQGHRDALRLVVVVAAVPTVALVRVAH